MTQPPDPTQPVTPLPPNIPPPPPPREPGPTAVMPPAPTSPPPGAAGPADRALLVRAGLGVLVVALTVLAQAVEENGLRGYSAYTTWAVFATVMAAVHLLPLVWKAAPRVVWDTVAIATGGLVFFWVALVLPFIGTGASFAQTLAVALALAHLWLLPGRR